MKLYTSLARAVVIVAVIVTSFFVYANVLCDDVSVDINGSGYTMRYFVYWGIGMEERFDIYGNSNTGHAFSSDWMEIVDKSYNSGGTIYIDDTDGAIYIRMSFLLFIFNTVTRTTTKTCLSENSPSHRDDIRISRDKPYSTAELYGSEEKYIRGYIPAKFSDYESGRSTPSLYYNRLRYLGRFGVIEGSWRGIGVGFLSGSNDSEPTYSLDVTCG